MINRNKNKTFILIVILVLSLSVIISKTPYIKSLLRDDSQLKVDTLQSTNESGAESTGLKNSTKNKKKDKAKTQPSKSETKNNKKSKDILYIKGDTTGLSKHVLDLALKAYNNAKKEDGIENHKLTVIDYSLPSNQKRLWVIDMDKKEVLIHTHVSHGARTGDRVAREFSNKVGSHKSSVGVMKTGNIYYGNSGMSLHLHGLEDDINDNVYNRHVVIHGSNYVSESIANRRGKVGKSFGCPAVDYKIAKPLIQKIANGSLVFAYYPLKSWLKNSEYLI